MASAVALVLLASAVLGTVLALRSTDGSEPDYQYVADFAEAPDITWSYEPDTARYGEVLNSDYVAIGEDQMALLTLHGEQVDDGYGYEMDSIARAVVTTLNTDTGEVLQELDLVAEVPGFDAIELGRESEIAGLMFHQETGHLYFSFYSVDPGAYEDIDYQYEGGQEVGEHSEVVVDTGWAAVDAFTGEVVYSHWAPLEVQAGWIYGWIYGSEEEFMEVSSSETIRFIVSGQAEDDILVVEWDEHLNETLLRVDAQDGETVVWEYPLPGAQGRQGRIDPRQRYPPGRTGH